MSVFLGIKQQLQKLRIYSPVWSQRLVGVLAVTLIAAIGVYFLTGSRAATPYVSREVEDGTLANGAMLQSNSGASGGKYVQFGGSSTGNVGLDIHVTGNHLVNASGQNVLLHGANRSGAEYMCVQGRGIFDGPSDATSVAAMAAWHINVVRIPMNEDCWLGINGVNPSYSGQLYQKAIRDYVDVLHAHGIYVILELHWSAPDGSLPTGQNPFPDADHSPTFWSSVATTFKDDHAALFDVFNEPYDNAGGDPWNCWKNGCNDVGYQTSGMQSLVTAIRSTGASQPIMLGGLNYANNLSGWLANKPNDPNNQLVASVHFYNFNYPCNNLACFQSGQYSLLPIAQQVPVVFGELGENDCAGSFITPVMDWIDNNQNNGFSGYLGWTWNDWPGGCSSGPTLITNYDGTPTNFGKTFKDHYTSVASNGR